MVNLNMFYHHITSPYPSTPSFPILDCYYLKHHRINTCTTCYKTTDTMDILPEPLLNYIGSFLDAKDCASCRLASPKLSQMCNSVKEFAFTIANAEAGQFLAQKLKSISNVFPCLKRCKIYCTRILNAQGAERSITMPGVEIELEFDMCIEDAIDTIIGWFSEVTKVSLNWSTITGNERFLRHRIFSLKTYINKDNANLFNTGSVSKIQNLSVRINSAYLDLSGIDTSCNKELVLCLGPIDFS